MPGLDRVSVSIVSTGMYLPEVNISDSEITE